MKTLCMVYQKSHCDMPDIEDMEVVLTDNKCVLKYACDVDDMTGVTCGSEIIWKGKKGVCSDCGATYIKQA